MRVKTREPGDPLLIRLNAKEGDIVLTTDSVPEPPQREGYVVKKACNLYKQKDN